MKSNLLIHYRIILITLTLQIVNIQSHAQWSSDVMLNNPVVTHEFQQFSCKLVSDNAGGAIITWWDRDNNSSDHNIYAQRINSTGNIQWNTRGVGICTDPASLHTPQIIGDGNGGAIIAWFDQRNPKGNEDFVQKINSEGVVQWTANGVSVGTVETHFQHGTPAITTDGSGGVIVAWSDWRGDLGHPEMTIRAQKISSSGIVMWELGGLALNKTTKSDGNPQIVSDGNGGAIITWDKWVGIYPDGNRDIYAQKINSNGSLVWGEDGLIVCSQTSEQRLPMISSDGSGGAIVSWEDYRNGTKSNLYTQKINSSGEIKWTANGIPVSTSTTNGQINHKLISDGNGGVFYVWEYTSGTVCVQLLNSNGERQWTGDGASVCGFCDSRFPDITSDGGTGVIVTWNKNFSYIMAQHLNSNGESLWDSRGNYVSYNNSRKNEPKLIADGNGGAILAWDDYRNELNSSLDIFAQNINANGTIGQKTGIKDIENVIQEKLTLNQNHPNPFREQTYIDYEIVTSGKVTLKVYDMTGREIKTLVNDFLKPGNYSACFNASGLPEGMYYYKLAEGNETISMSMIWGFKFLSNFCNACN